MAPEQINDAADGQVKGEITLDDDSSDDDETSKSSLGHSKSEKMRKITHSEIERRRREKMNRYIDEIAQLLPIDAVKKLDKLTVLRVAVDTIKHLKGASSKSSSTGFGKQIYLNDNELLELTLATIDQIGNYFFLIIECQTGQICYASSSTEAALGYKPTELCSQSIFNLVHPSDRDIVKQQLIHEKAFSTLSTDELSNDSKCLSVLTNKKSCLEVGNRRTFSCRVYSKNKRAPRTTTNTTASITTIDLVGYLKQYSLTADHLNDAKARNERRRSTSSALTSADVFSAIGTTNPVSCLIAMGNVSKKCEQSNTSEESVQTIERMFLCKLNPDGQFTYFDQICHSVLGYLSQELIGMDFNDFIHEDDRTKFAETWNRVCHDRQIVTSGNYRFRIKDNTFITLQTIFEPFIHPWTDELEIIVARNKIRTRSTRTQVSNQENNENPSSVDTQSPTNFDSTADFLSRLLA